MDDRDREFLDEQSRLRRRDIWRVWMVTLGLLVCLFALLLWLPDNWPEAHWVVLSFVIACLLFAFGREVAKGMRDARKGD